MINPFYNQDNKIETLLNHRSTFGVKEFMMGVDLGIDKESTQFSIKKLKEASECYFEDSNEVLMMLWMHLLDVYYKQFEDDEEYDELIWAYELLAKRLKESSVVHSKRKVFYCACFIHFLVVYGSSVEQAKKMAMKFFGINKTDTTVAYAHFKKLAVSEVDESRYLERKVLGFCLYNNLIADFTVKNKVEEKAVNALGKYISNCGKELQALHKFLLDGFEDFPELNTVSDDEKNLALRLEGSPLETLMECMENNDLRVFTANKLTNRLYADCPKIRSMDE